MRVVTWNCNEGFARKFAHLCSLDFDIAVVTECGPFETSPVETSREVSAVLKLAVQQPGHTKHIGVLAREPWRVEALSLVSDQPWVLPTRVTGPVDFTVLALWALDREWVADRISYAAQTARVVDEILPSLDGPVVLAGDLNAPIPSDPGDAFRHERNVRQLAARGLLSVYTTARGDLDPLIEPTLYHQRKSDRPFHIDHIFVPRKWTPGIDVAVGTYEEWVGGKRSDHVPVIADVVVTRVSSAPDN